MSSRSAVAANDTVVETAPPGRGTRMAASSAGVAGSGMLLLGRLVRAVTAIVAVIIVAGILFVVLKASPSNDIVKTVHDAARWLAGPFDGMFNLKNPRAEIAVNWGIATAVYVVVGSLVAGVIERAGARARERSVL